MGTRSGDLDPAVHMHLHRSLGWSLDDIDRALNRESGLKGLAGHNDFREVMRLRAAGDEAAALAFDVYCYRIRKYVGAYYAVLGTVDAVVFTAGVGEHSPELRAAASPGLCGSGSRSTPAATRARSPGPPWSPPTTADVAVLVVPTNEEYEIARQTLSLVGRRSDASTPRGLVGVSLYSSVVSPSRRRVSLPGRPGNIVTAAATAGGSRRRRPRRGRAAA